LGVGAGLSVGLTVGDGCGFSVGFSVGFGVAAGTGVEVSVGMGAFSPAEKEISCASAALSSAAGVTAAVAVGAGLTSPRDSIPAFCEQPLKAITANMPSAIMCFVFMLCAPPFSPILWEYMITGKGTNKQYISFFGWLAGNRG
jgi:hypothetical protein